jgi:hypothetical protein
MLIMGSLLAFEPARGDTFGLNDGQTLTGDVVSFDENGLIVRTPEGKYSDRTPWTKFSQADLKKLGQQNRKIAPLVEPFIEVSQEERIKKTEVEIKPVPRLDRPPAQSLLGALASSSVGWFMLLLLYAANIYAAYEVSVFRAQPRGLVCGLAAIPMIGIASPIVFLCLPTRMDRNQQPELPPEVVAAASQTFSVPGAPAPEATEAAAGNLRISHAAGGHGTGSLPQTQVFQRGAFTFNRRFFETKFAGFFGTIRRDAEKDMVLLVKAGRNEYIGQRITRIAANDLHLSVLRGPATEEVRVPFTDIQEVQLKHKDA